MIYQSIRELVGTTPILKLNKIEIPNNNAIYAKCEFKNPAGGIKDRFAFFAFERLLESGKINKNSIIVEVSAGNTGLGIALAALEYKIKAIIFVPEKFSLEKQILMRALGARVVLTPKDEGLEGATIRAKEFLAKTPNAFNLEQFSNKDNPKAHYETTAREIYADLGDNIDYFVCGAGTGGTFSGISLFLKERINNIKCVLCDPKGSVIGGGKKGEAHIEGIGNDFVPENMDLSLVDEVIKISDNQAYIGLKMLAKKEGILAGISSGACLSAALKLAKNIKNKNIVIILADGLQNYLSKNLI